MNCNIKKTGSYVLKTFLPALLLTCIVIAAVSPVSCKATEEGLIILEGDFKVPEIKGFSVADSNTLCVEFSEEVTLEDFTVSYVKENDNVPVEVHAGNSRDKNITIIFEQPMNAGFNYVLEGVVRDLNGNSLTLSIPFTGWNSNVPVLAISEIYLGNYMINDSYRLNEFAEFYALTSGNLSGLHFSGAFGGVKCDYSFPPAEVKAGDYIVLHLRRIADSELGEGEVMADETENNLALSTTLSSCSTARDFWSSNVVAPVGKKCDVFVLENKFDGTVKDAFMFTDGENGMPEKYSEMYERVCSSGKWKGEPFNGFGKADLKGHSISRQNIKSLKADGFVSCSDDYIVTSGKGRGDSRIEGVTPGTANCTNPYVMKTQSSVNSK